MERLRQPLTRLLAPVVAALVRLGVTADAITISGCLGSMVVAGLIAAGWLPTAGLVYLLVSALDFFDGAVARASGTARPFGAFLDSLLDRIAESAPLTGLVYYYAAGQHPVEAALVSVATVGSLAVSYARARAEGLGLECTVGWFQRPERVVLLGAGLLVPNPLLLPAIVLLAVLTTITVWQRGAHVARLLAGPPREA